MFFKTLYNVGFIANYEELIHSKEQQDYLYEEASTLGRLCVYFSSNLSLTPQNLNAFFTILKELGKVIDHKISLQLVFPFIREAAIRDDISRRLATLDYLAASSINYDNEAIEDRQTLQMGQ